MKRVSGQLYQSLVNISIWLCHNHHPCH